MEITLIRHGKSLWRENKVMSCHEFTNWIEQYDQHGVQHEQTFPINTVEKVSGANVVLTSDLKRAIESAEQLRPNVHVISDRLFRETELPRLREGAGGKNWIKLSAIKLNASNWAFILRCAWLCGYSNQCESLNDAKRRAEEATRYLVSCAEQHQNVVLVGHGFLNMLIGKQLVKLGWNGRRRTSTSHWSATTYSL